MNHEKEVYFYEYCDRCKYQGVEESDPYGKCNDCLTASTQIDSHKPMNFEEADS